MNDDKNLLRSDNIAGNYAETSDASCSSFVGESHSGPREAKHFATRLCTSGIREFLFYLRHFTHFLVPSRIWTFTTHRVKATVLFAGYVMPIKKSYKSLTAKEGLPTYPTTILFIRKRDASFRSWSLSVDGSCFSLSMRLEK